MKKIIVTLSMLLVSATILFGCNFKIPKISWEEEKIEVPAIATTISGTLFAFDVSVVTDATHRLEKDNKLVALIASEIVNLEIFEGRKVELTGFSKSEGKRNVFWVHSIDLKDDLDRLISDEEVFDDTYVKAKDFTFLYPKNWEMFTAPNGGLYFSEKGDANRRAFFTFTVEDVEEADLEKEKNIMISGLKGTKEITAEEKRERQRIELFAENGMKKYVFQFNSLFEEFEKKNAFFSLLNSFVTGEKVGRVVGKRQKEIADQKADLLKKKDELSEIRSQLEALKAAEDAKRETDSEEEASESVFDKLIDYTKKAETKNEEKEKVVEAEEIEALDTEIEEEERENEPENISDINNFENLIDGRAYLYESDFLSLNLKIPYGFWFKNFGNVNGTLATIGAQKSKISGLSGTDFRIEIVKKTGGVSSVIETEINGKTIIDVPRKGFKNSLIRISGSSDFRDAMHSVRSTIR